MIGRNDEDDDTLERIERLREFTKPSGSLETQIALDRVEWAYRRALNTIRNYSYGVVLTFMVGVVIGLLVGLTK